MVASQIKKWEIFELKLEGPKEGNPFMEVALTAQFATKEKVVSVEGFYDGNSSYIIRFMPDIEGQWDYHTESNVEVLNGVEGSFNCIAPEENNHGPVQVHNQYHFCYADGTPYFPFGTTCYAWIHQSNALQEETIESLSKSPFNKLRMCVFPKHYSNNSNEPELYPFEGVAPNNWDFTRFNPAFFAHLEKRVIELQQLGIEVDLILFHPYDKGHWGFDRMDSETDARYLRYIIARLGAFRNVWWSMANEYDYMEMKTETDWDRNIELVANTDPYHHLVSIHNGDELYNHTNPNLTHASIQYGQLRGMVNAGVEGLKILRNIYRKPIIFDEVGYEGNLIQRWGKLKGEELTAKFWQAITSGNYMTHGETFTHPEEIIWWAKGGTLRGKSPKRINFLRQIVEESGLLGLEPLDKWWVPNGVGKNGEYYLYYFGYEKPTEWRFELPAFKIDVPMGTKFRVEIIDTWNMTITPVEELYEITDQERYNYTCNYNPTVALPGKEFIALRIIKAE